MTERHAFAAGMSETARRHMLAQRRQQLLRRAADARRLLEEYGGDGYAAELLQAEAALERFEEGVTS